MNIEHFKYIMELYFFCNLGLNFSLVTYVDQRGDDENVGVDLCLCRQTGADVFICMTSERLETGK